MLIRAARFAGEYAALSAWTGKSDDQLRQDEDLHAEEREHWLAWDGDRVVGALHPWRGPDGRLRLYFDRCRDDAYRELVSCVHGDCLTQIDLDATGARYRRRGLAQALISRAFAALEREEVDSVRAEADAGDSAANLLKGLGTVVVGGSMELHRGR